MLGADLVCGSLNGVAKEMVETGVVFEEGLEGDGLLNGGSREPDNSSIAESYSERHRRF
jgi:hypothetical protein